MPKAFIFVYTLNRSIMSGFILLQPILKSQIQHRKEFISMSDYQSTHLVEEIVINQLLTVHYFEYTSDYSFSGESHNFWEFLYVDKGAIDVVSGSSHHSLTKGQIIFHKPQEFHSLSANGMVAPNLVVIAFECDSPPMEFFHDHLQLLGDNERNLLARIVKEAQQAYHSPLDDPNLKCLHKNEDAPFGSEQFIKISLQLLLLQLIRDAHSGKIIASSTSAIREHAQEDLYHNILIYLSDHVADKLTLEKVCRDNIIGRSYLQKLFREKSGGGVMEYFGNLKIDVAKQHIRENTHNFTEISQILGYTSIHYFSRHFKKNMGMTPTEYATSIKSRSIRVLVDL